MYNQGEGVNSLQDVTAARRLGKTRKRSITR